MSEPLMRLRHRRPPDTTTDQDGGMGQKARGSIPPRVRIPRPRSKEGILAGYDSTMRNVTTPMESQKVRNPLR